MASISREPNGRRTIQFVGADDPTLDARADLTRRDGGDDQHAASVPRVGDPVPLPLLSKEEVAAKILDQVVVLLETRDRDQVKDA